MSILSTEPPGPAMNVLFPADGSAHTQKALSFLVTHPELLGSDGRLTVLHVQAPMLPRVAAMMSSAAVHDYQQEEAGKVLAPIEEFLKRHECRFSTKWVVGSPAAEIVQAAHEEGDQLILMGTHGHGLVGRLLMGSVAQNVVSLSQIPVLLIK